MGDFKGENNVASLDWYWFVFGSARMRAEWSDDGVRNSMWRRCGVHRGEMRVGTAVSVRPVLHDDVLSRIAVP